jgi:hypothetical protein
MAVYYFCRFVFTWTPRRVGTPQSPSPLELREVQQVLQCSTAAGAASAWAWLRLPSLSSLFLRRLRVPGTDRHKFLLLKRKKKKNMKQTNKSKNMYSICMNFTSGLLVIFHIVMASLYLQMAVFWVVASCSLVEVY